MNRTHDTPRTAIGSRLRAEPVILASMMVLGVIMLLSVLAPWIAPYDYAAQDLVLGATAPSWQHWLGTDPFGRDLLTRILHGGRVSLAVGALATAVALVIGVSWGAVAGYAGGRVDAWMMRTVDILYALPFTVFVILLTVTFGRSLLLLFLAIGCVEWLTMARIVRGQVMVVRRLPYVDAAVTLGLPAGRILAHHVIPNVTGPIIVYATLTVPGVILLESFLSFLGLGVQPPEASWGVLIAQGVETLEEYPWLLVAPALFLTTTLFCLNVIGDGLRDILAPESAPPQ